MLRPLPPGITHPLTEDGMGFLPAFVRNRLEYLADVFNGHPDEGDDPCDFTYYEVRGRLSDGYYSVAPGKHITPINIWIGSDDDCNRSLYIGGSGCWICPNSHYLFFDAIDPALLEDSFDRNVWWCIQHGEGFKVIKILACQPEDEVTEDFPDGV